MTAATDCDFPQYIIASIETSLKKRVVQLPSEAIAMTLDTSTALGSKIKDA